MDLERAVEDFVHRGKDLFERLRAEGQTLSSVGLQILRTQLHIVGIEAARLKQATYRAERAKTRHEAGAPDQPTTEKKKLKPVATCSHSRAIDYHLDEGGNWTSFYYCLECRAVIKDPYVSE